MSDTSTALAVRPASLGSYSPPPAKEELASIIELANYLAKAPGFLPTHYFGQNYKIMAAMLYARELGISSFIAFQHMQVIDGKAGADAQLMGTLVARAGHTVDPCLDRKEPGKSRTCRITRGDTGVSFEVTWTIEMAQQAKLAAKDNWRNYPDSMLWARALSQCAREACPDALMGIAYTSEELGSGEVIEGEVIDQAPAQSMERVAAPAPQGVSEAGSAPQPAAIQPAPPAASVGESAKPIAPASSEEKAGERIPAAPREGSAPPPAPDRSARSVGPKAKRTHVVAADQTIPAPAQEATEPVAAPAPTEQATTSEEAKPELEAPAEPAQELHPVALVEEAAPAPDPDAEGRMVYLDQMREEGRKGAATLHLLRVKLKNQKAALAGEPQQPVPPGTPNADSDESLRLFIDSNYPSRKLGDLREGELENVLGVIQGLIDKIHETGVKE
ncbi:MAG: recombinase RecT [Solirubrobacterales bacterium]